jgi:hypothetical protein
LLAYQRFWCAVELEPVEVRGADAGTQSNQGGPVSTAGALDLPCLPQPRRRRNRCRDPSFSEPDG